jgi:protein tyrosine/serine phosphatase
MRRKKERQDLPNFAAVTESIYRGGQPSLDGLRQLHEKGIRTIVTFRDAGETIKREREAAEELGFIFINLHLSNWFAPRDEDIRQIVEIISDPIHQPVFIHCKRGADRTGTVVAAYRMLKEGWTDREANAEALEYGLGWWQVWMKNYIRAFYRRLKGEKS